MSSGNEVSETDLAIVGMSCRFVGSPDPQTFWRNLREGVECIQTYSDEELLASGLDAATLSDPAYVKAGGRLDHVDEFDAGFFAFGPKDAAIVDPQHRHFMEIAYEALEDAGHPPGRFPGTVGVFAGCGMNSYFMFNLLRNPQIVESTGLFLLRHTGNDRDFLPTTLSYKLNLRGPSLAIQTACSTSLVATHVAAQSLLSGECDLALAGGVTIDVPHGRGYMYRDGEVLSPDGHCRAFDARGAGTVLTSGAGVVVLRRLEDALADADHVYAVIKGSAINNDGSAKVGYLAPGVDGQAEVIAEALAVAGLSADEISYVETHGTGTSVGDPIEISALTQAFQASTEATGFCGIGSNKPNIGHTDTAAGVASLIKVALSLDHGEIPPSINFERPNPAIDFERSPFFVNTELRPWESQGPRRAGVSSLGVGGTNAHVIVEEAPAREPGSLARGGEILPLSARSSAALARASERLAEHLEGHPDLSLADVAHTLQLGRDEFDHRRVVVCESASEAIESLRSEDAKRLIQARAASSPPSVVFLFPGGGAQYPEMARGLFEREPVFRDAMEECLHLLKPIMGHDLGEILYPADPSDEQIRSELDLTVNSIPAIFATEYSLAKLWMSWGIEPDAMTGHSLGEYTAACLAGVLELRDALFIVALRGRLFASVDTPGAMLSIPLPEAEVRELLGNELDLAAINGPAFCVVSGRSHDVDDLERKLREQDVECRSVGVPAAAHSRLLDGVLDEFRRELAKIRFHEPKLAYVSNLTGTWVDPEAVQDAEFWVRHLRETVHFSAGLATLLESGQRVLLEVGPGHALCSLARQQQNRPAGIVPSLPHPDEEASDTAYVRGALGRLWCHGVPLDWAKIRGEQRRLRVPLPTYPFERQRFWIEPVAEAVSAPSQTALARIEDPDAWFFESGWRREELAVTRGAQERDAVSETSWLVFADADGFCQDFVHRLRGHGARVVVVTAGDAFYRLAEDRYVLSPEAGIEGYASLIQDLAENDRLPDRIAHFWLVTRERTARPGSSFFHRVEEQGFYSLLLLAQALGAEDVGKPIHLGVVSSGLQQVGDEPLADPEKATVLGPVRVIPREYPGFSCQSIDLDRACAEAEPDEATTAALLLDIHPDQADRIVAYRDGQRFVEAVEPLPAAALAPREARPRLRQGGVYLITGGFGGLGLVTARHLVRTVGARLVLTGRSELPERTDWQEWIDTHGFDDPTSEKLRAVQELEAEGAQVLVATADVANIESMNAVLEATQSRFGSLHGVFHVAGVVDDEPIQSKSQNAIERVFSSKVHGTLLLHALLQDRDVDFLTLFSSSSSLIGPAGQVDYVAATSFMNAFARSLAGRPGPYTVAIDWGVWRDTGMAVELFRRFGGATEVERAVAHPVLGRCIGEGGEERIFANQLEASGHWILDEHRTGSGSALIPGTGFLDLACAAAADARGTSECEIQDAFFLAPLMVPDDSSVEARVVLRGAGPTLDFEIESREEGEDEWQLHAQGRVAELGDRPPGQLAIGEIEARCPNLESAADDGGTLETSQSRHLKFGSHWRCVRAMRFGSGEAVARLALQPEHQRETALHPLHPALLDMATGFATPLLPGYDGARLYAPMGYRRVRVYAPLPASVVSFVRLSEGGGGSPEIGSFDVTLLDEDGAILVEIEGFSVRRLDDGDAFARTRGGVRHAPRASARRAASGQKLTAAERSFRESYELGIRPEEGVRALDRILAGGDHAQVIVSSVPIDVLIERARRAADAATPSEAQFARPELESTYVAPRDDVETQLAGFWSELLGVEQVGIDDDFFELGGHSLVAVRLFSKIKKAWGLELSLSVLFDAPTVSRLAELVRDEIGISLGETQTEPAVRKPRHRFLVRLQAGDPERTPFFLVAGMFGNVLNLRHVAAHLGSDQTVWAIQAKGLLGDDEPHSRFEDMARDYLEELRQVQPEGPYLLGGFSGGGITAFEMAHQLRAAGQEVASVILLDSLPAEAPAIRAVDRLVLNWRKLQRQGPSYFLTWARNRMAWERQKRAGGPPTYDVDLSPAEFRSSLIEQAFRDALVHYRETPYPGALTLFRPSHAHAYRLAGGRLMNEDRQYIDAQNRWGPFARDGIEVHEVTGDHDSMVLEPHVRVLAAKLRECLDLALAKQGEAKR